MNSKSTESNFLELLWTLNHAYLPLALVAFVIAIFGLIALIIFFVKTDRKMTQLSRIFLRFASNSDSSPQMVASPDKTGKFHPPVWCGTCNAFVDHVDNLCPHVGEKLYFSSFHRRFSEYWRQQLSHRYQSTVHLAPNVTTSAPNITIDLNELLNNRNRDHPIDRKESAAASNCAIDLNELLNNRNGNHSIDRQESTTSIDSSAPCKTSTPDGHWRRVSRFQSQFGFNKLRRMSTIKSLNSRRSSKSSGSSGIGSASSEDEEHEQQNLPTFVKRFVPTARRWASNLSGNRPSIAPKINLRPTPSILVHECSPNNPQFPNVEQHQNNANAVSSNKYLRVTCAWNGPTPGHAVRCGSPGLRRATSELQEIHYHPIIRRTLSDANAASFSSDGPVPNCNIDHQVLVHASANGPSSDISNQ